MMGGPDSPPRVNGKLCFSKLWQRQAFGVALALSKRGHFDWEDFSQKLIAAIGDWERSHSLDDPSWNYYELWLTALEQVVTEARLATAEELEAQAMRNPNSGQPSGRPPDDYQPLFHVEHAAGGSELEPLNIWRIVILTENNDQRFTEP